MSLCVGCFKWSKLLNYKFKDFLSCSLACLVCLRSDWYLRVNPPEVLQSNGPIKCVRGRGVCVLQSQDVSSHDRLAGTEQHVVRWQDVNINHTAQNTHSAIKTERKNYVSANYCRLLLQ